MRVRSLYTCRVESEQLRGGAGILVARVANWQVHTVHLLVAFLPDQGCRRSRYWSNLERKV